MSPTPGTNRDDPNADGESKEVEAMETPQFIVAAESSDDESGEEMDTYGGYQMLPQEPSAMDEVMDSDNTERTDDDFADFESFQAHGEDEDVDVTTVPEYGRVGLATDFQLPPIASAGANERRNVWDTIKTDKEPLEDEQIDKIKGIMANVVLPKMQVPDWARVVPEEEWKSQLFTSLQPNTTTSHASGKSDSKDKNVSCQRQNSSDKECADDEDIDELG